MYLKKLELYGFKSFANKTEFIFEPGVTAIVGPNGCGKSNISDAIRWVLGEQSAKSLRGLEMKDVIFNGTTVKEPVNFAEVSLTLSNHSKTLPIDYEEVTIARRLFRSGESEYLLNKNTVRLKDISELLMGTGIGVDNYFLMEQGKIDLILSSKPEERRAIFEEASGITKFKSKKREAMNKLDATEANLLRLNDIISEVQRQINSIERQAAKARRYKKHFERLKDLELCVSRIEYDDIESQRAKINEEIAILKAGQAKLSSDVEALLSEIRSVRQELEGIDSFISEIKNNAASIDNSLFRAKERVQLDNERIAELDVSIVDLAEHIKLSVEKVEGLKAQIAQLEKEKESFSSEKTSKENALKEKHDLLVSLEKSIEEAQSKIANAKAHVLEKTSNITKSKNELAKTSANSTSALNRFKRLELEKQDCLNALSRSKDKVSAVGEQVVVQAQKVSEAESLAQAVDIELKNAQQRSQSLDEERGRTQKELTVAESRVVLLQDMIEKYQGFADSAKAFLSDTDIDTKPWYGHIRALISDLNACVESNDALSSLAEKLQALADEKARNEQVVCELGARLSALNEQLTKEHIEFANRQAAKIHSDEEFAKLKDEFSVVELELDDISEEIGKLKQQDESLKVEIEALEKELHESSEIINSNQNWIHINSKEKESALVEVARTKAELDAFNQRYSDLENNISVLVESVERENSLYQARSKQIDDSKARIIFLEEEIRQLTAELEKRQTDKVAVENQLTEASSRRKEASERISQKEFDYEKLQKDLQAVNSSVYEQEAEASQFSFQQQRLYDRINQFYKIDLGSYKLLIQIEFNVETARTEIEELRAKLDSIGSVNLDSLGEETELHDRFNNMVTQRDDLLKAKENLMDAITKINKTTKDLFVETFDKIQVEFRNFFKLLFGGGDTELFLVDESDVLESGIEIVAKPPGKRLQNISLLSGGEKTMTALALLFAVFKIKPSPFCVLDEMDAPLDEANIDRFSKVLQEFTRNSQFIIITHNKKTIAISDVMYGITMEESGISKVVSVKFGENSETASKEEPVLAA